MLVLDDEADDGSILDAVVEASEDPVYGNLKQIPRAIANLWDSPRGSPENLFSTYIAYTATPQANLLQEGHNPLAPRDFMISLRTPLDMGHPVDTTDPGSLNAPRSSTYPEPVGIRSYYTGGEVFYRRAETANLCVPTTNSAQQDLGDAVRAFLVAGAIRLHRSGKLGPVSALTAQFDIEQEALDCVAPPHSMLYHPSAAIMDHFRGAEDILLWAGVQDREAARNLLDAGDARLPDTLVSDLQADPAPWAQWLDKYLASDRAIEGEFDVLPPKTFPDWQTIETLLIEEVIPGTRVAVVNSDPSADDRPAYTPSQDPETGKWSAARDPASDLERIASQCDIKGPFIGLLTAVPLHKARFALAEEQGLRVGVLATAGIGNATSAGITPPHKATPGTINLIVLVDAALTRAAMVNAIITATEAKTATLTDMAILTPDGALATGTSTDTVTVATTGLGAPHAYAGPATVPGWLIAKAVRQVVRDSLLVE